MSPQEVGPSSSMESDGSHDRSSAIDTYTQSDLGEHEVMAVSSVHAVDNMVHTDIAAA